MKKEIIANRDGDVLGVYYKKGDPVPITPKQAACMMAPYDNQLVFKKAVPIKQETKPAKSPSPTGGK